MLIPLRMYRTLEFVRHTHIHYSYIILSKACKENSNIPIAEMGNLRVREEGSDGRELGLEHRM